MTHLIVHSPLQRIIERETFREILDMLQPMELMIAVMRLEGLTDDEIARLLGVSRTTISSRMRRVSERLIHLRPDLAPILKGRRQSRRPPDRDNLKPLEQGWLCTPAPEE